MSKYNVKVKEGNTEIDETVEVDTQNEFEKIHIPSNGDTSESAPGEVDVIFDFKLVSNREGLGTRGSMLVCVGQGVRCRCSFLSYHPLFLVNLTPPFSPTPPPPPHLPAYLLGYLLTFMLAALL